MPDYTSMTSEELRRRLAMCQDRATRAETTLDAMADMATEQEISDVLNDRFAEGYLAYGKRQPRPEDVEAAAGWDDAKRASKVRVVMPERPEGYYHAKPGTFD